ncbi:PepSY-associated TM helix domain-containing protein [Verticiella sediminum]|nr:PepSY-associated TM helix domain-containing protein [Verticiella sediminum]
MAWLHTWTGLPLGWLLYAVFFTGTLSYYLDEVNAWTRPELHRSAPAPQTAERALQTMQQLAPDAESWTLALPNERQMQVQASWRPAGAPAGRGGQQRAELDAATGQPIAARETRAGNFLYRFHFELYGMPRVWGRWVVAIATLLMFVAILSGVVTHKKIFTEFFTFRPRKGQRSWLDAHNATAVLALPFHLMITFSGLLLFMYMLLPAGINAAYDGDTRAYFAERQQAGRGAGPGAAARVTEPVVAGVPLAPVGPMLAEAQRRWPGREVGSIAVNRPGTSAATVELREHGGTSLVDRGASRRLVFDGVTGAVQAAPAGSEPGVASAVYNVLTAAHLGRFAGPGLRLLLFLCGVVGTVMVATGLVLWVVKRLPERRKAGRTPFGHRLVELLNLGTIGGLSLALAACLWLNRLLPATLAGRADWEIQGFFAVWALAFLHAGLRPARRAWIEQLALATVLFALLPLLNPLTGGLGLWASVPGGAWPVAGFDLAMLLLALVHGAAWRWLVQRGATPSLRSARARSPVLPGAGLKEGSAS